jgi:hypothetical protein
MKKGLLFVVCCWWLGCGAQCNLAIALSYQPIICFNTTLDSVLVNLNGGVAPYTYHWSNALQGSIGMDIFPGNFSVTVTDANSCTASALGTCQAAPDFFPISVVSTDYCYTPILGELHIETIGSEPPYWYEVIKTDSQLHIGPTYSGDFYNLLPGSYTWRATDAKGCRKVAPFFIADSGICVGIKDLSQSAIRITPNPASTIFTLQSENTFPPQTSFQLFALSGRMVLQQEIKEKTNRIDISGLSKGMYLYSVLKEKERMGEGKVIIE